MVQGKCFVMVLGNTKDSHKTFLDEITKSAGLQEVSSVNDSDVIIAFVPISSRAGTDISAAMQRIPENKPVVLVVLHHTFNADEVVPDSRQCVSRKDVFAVDCVFHEDVGLLRCQRNDDAIRAVKEHLTGVFHTKKVDHIWKLFGAGIGLVLGAAIGWRNGAVIGAVILGAFGVFIGGCISTHFGGDIDVSGPGVKHK